MKIDFYTKAVFTVIAIMLSIIAVTPLVRPAPAHAAANPTHFAIDSNGWIFLYEDGSNTVRRYGPDGKWSADIHLNGGPQPDSFFHQ